MVDWALKDQLSIYLYPFRHNNYLSLVTRPTRGPKGAFAIVMQSLHFSTDGVDQLEERRTQVHTLRMTRVRVP